MRPEEHSTSASRTSDRLTAVSLFASSGIGDLALRAAGADVLVANEFLADRADLFRVNFPESVMITGDIRELADQIIREASSALRGRELDILFATPPCQGMSKNGRGKLLRGVRDGLRDALDPRNQLATFVPPIIESLRPRLVVFENVPEMEGVLVENEDGELVGLLECLILALPNYVGNWKIIEFADFGVPQRRKRLITIFARKDLRVELDERPVSEILDALYPMSTHDAKGAFGRAPWLTVSEVIGHLPPLDASSKASARCLDVPFHYVPVLDSRKYWWVSSTPEQGSAFDNQCVNPSCRFEGNPTHGSSKSTGINRANVDTPIYCSSCGELLPRPTVEDVDGPRLMKGFTSAYKRMSGALPASAMTRNLSYACSDQKLHPTQHRVLSLYEAMLLHTITDYEYCWRFSNGKLASDKLIRDSIGESIPPRGLEVLFRHVFTSVLGYENRLRAGRVLADSPDANRLARSA